MGVSNSKAETCEPLRLCKERKKYMKQAIDSRYNLAAAHVVYIQSLQNIGTALRKFADIQLSVQPPPSLPQIVCNTATAGGVAQSGSSPPPHSPNNSSLNYMKSSGVGSVTVNLTPSMISNSNDVYANDVDSLSFTMSPSPPLPPPPPPPPRLSWDYFNPTEGSFRLMAREGVQANLNNSHVHDHFNDKDTDLEELVTHPEPMKNDQNRDFDDNLIDNEATLICQKAQIETCDSKDDCLAGEETECIHNRGKDFLSSIKDIEDLFIRASKSGNEVSRMLEASKIQVSYSEAKGSSTGSSSSLLTCFRGENAHVLHDSPRMAKVITWRRSMSSNSSQSNDDTVNNFIQEFCMIAGSHSSTLERLYAWERKLYDEVKASECIRKEYDKKCDEMRHQFAKDLKPHIIDKTRAVAKDLHSRMRVSLHTVDSISKRIEKMRDDELQPQLMELIQGLIKMWKTMFECHQAQYITVSLSYISTNSITRDHQNETKNQIMGELQHEIECFGSSFSNMVKCYTSYVESINNWLQNCIVQPKERVKGRRAFSPRRAVAPPIFVMGRDWSAGIQTLPYQKLGDSINDFLCQIRRLFSEELDNIEINRAENRDDDDMGLNLSLIYAGLTKVLDRLTRFSEESLKMYEEITLKTETAGNVYSNYRPPPRAFSM